MNKEELLAWAVREVKVWPSTWSESKMAVKPASCEWCFTGNSAVLMNGAYNASVSKREWEAARVACGMPQFEPFVSVEDAPTPITAHSILEAAGGHMRDRAATYDKPEGERSMGATVEAFRAITGYKLTEEQGWLFMQLLKAVRSQQGAYRADSYEDGAAYVSLAGEAAARERGSNRAEG